MSRWIAAVVAACMFFSITPALAAATGAVRGIVTEGGRPQAGATVTIAGEGERFVVTTNAQGRYNVPTVPFGHYTLTVHENGTTDRTLDVDVSSDAVAEVNIDLLKTIVVTSARANAGAGGTPVAVTTIDQQQIATSPDRDSLNRLIETVPGVVQFSYNEPVINGFHGVTYNIDGAPLPLATTSNFAEIVDPRDINSIEVFTGAIPAEYGGDRMGGVVNIITDRFRDDLPNGTWGTISGGIGNQGQTLGEFDTVSRFGNNELYLGVNNSSTNRGIDAPTYTAINDSSSANDEFLRFVHKLNAGSTISADYSSQFSQFQIPINTDPNNPTDPIVAIPGTDDDQLEYNRYANIDLTSVSKSGNSVFTLIPWYRSTRIDYLGDLAADVQGYEPNFGCANYPACTTDTPPDPDDLNNVGLNAQTNADYVGVRVSEQLSSAFNTVKFGIDADRENSSGSQAYACAYYQCATGVGLTPVAPYFSQTVNQSQAGSQFGAYVQDQYQPNHLVSFDEGVRFDHSTGYVNGFMVEPRLGINVSDPSGRNVAHVFYGRYYAAPLLEDVRQACIVFQAQAGCANQNTGATVTNPAYDLKPEMDSYYEIGLQHTFDQSLTGWVNYFTKSVVNILDTTQLLNTPIFAVYNNSIGYNQGVEFRLQDRMHSGNNWFYTMTISNSYAGEISGGTFLFPPGTNTYPLNSPAAFSLEDHSQTFDSTGGYTELFGKHRDWFVTLQGNYGSGFPVAFQTADVNLNGTLPAHTTFDFSAGRNVFAGPGQKGLGITLDVNNLLNHQYLIKVANGFNTTQIANSRTFLLRLTQPF